MAWAGRHIMCRADRYHGRCLCQRCSGEVGKIPAHGTCSLLLCAQSERQPWKKVNGTARKRSPCILELGCAPSQTGCDGASYPSSKLEAWSGSICLIANRQLENTKENPKPDPNQFVRGEQMKPGTGDRLATQANHRKALGECHSGRFTPAIRSRGRSKMRRVKHKQIHNHEEYYRIQ